MQHLKTTKIKQAIKLITIILTLTLLSVAGCKKDDLEPAEALIGKWKWVKTVAFWTQNETTPKTEGHKEKWNFKTDGTVDIYWNSKLLHTYPYELRWKNFNPTNPNSDSTQMLIINNGSESFFYADNDSLVISYAYVDGETQYFKRKKI